MFLFKNCSQKIVFVSIVKQTLVFSFSFSFFFWVFGGCLYMKSCLRSYMSTRPWVAITSNAVNLLSSICQEKLRLYIWNGKTCFPFNNYRKFLYKQVQGWGWSFLMPSGGTCPLWEFIWIPNTKWLSKKLPLI